MDPATCGLTFAHYEIMLRQALDQGYRFSDFRSHTAVPTNQRLILIRHDIDLSVRNALRFARIEQKLDILTTYFVRVHAHQYNPFQIDSYRMLKQIKEIGHEIGLHYEPAFSQIFGEDPRTMIKREKRIVEAIFDTEIQSAAAHLPGKSGVTITEENVGEFGLKYEAYSPRFTRDFKYLSDSNGRWREGCLCQHLGKHDRICALIHPFWWYDVSPVENY